MRRWKSGWWLSTHRASFALWWMGWVNHYARVPKCQHLCSFPLGCQYPHQMSYSLQRGHSILPTKGPLLCVCLDFVMVCTFWSAQVRCSCWYSITGGRNGNQPFRQFPCCRCALILPNMILPSSEPFWCSTKQRDSCFPSVPNQHYLGLFNAALLRASFIHHDIVQFITYRNLKSLSCW